MTDPASPCANCGALLSGPWCSACGQRVEHAVPPVGEFLAEALEVFTHADSRFWRTFVPLLVRPGYLTQQFFAGRRASYLPPFRLYIVLSVVFFLVVPLTATLKAPKVLTPEARAAAAAEVRKDLQQDIDSATDPVEKAILEKQLRGITTVTDTLAPAGRGWDGVDCSKLVFGNGESIPPWLAGHATTACEKIREDHGRELGRSLLHNLGRAMLVLVPLLAALMKLLYWRQHRYYLEHLLLLLHNHAYVFLGMSVLLIATRLIPSEAVGGILGSLFTLYMGWYLYESMRRFYGQGWAVTFIKFWVLAGAYLACAVLMLLLTTVYSAVTL